MLNNKFNAALFKNRNQESKLWKTKENSPRNQEKKGGLQNNSMIISFFPLECKVNPKEKNLKEGENSQGNGFTCKS